MAVEFSTPIRFLRGVGEAKNACFAKLGLVTAGELIGFFPRSYEDRGNIKLVSECPEGENCALLLTVRSAPVLSRSMRSGISYIKFTAGDESGSVEVTFFNQPWLEKSIVVGRRFRFYGKLNYGSYCLEMSSPEMEVYNPELPSILPVYPLTKGLTQGAVSGAMREAACLIDLLPETLPQSLREKHGLMSRRDAYRALHFPKSMEEVAKAKHSLAFEELLVFQLAVRRLRGKLETFNAPAMSYKDTGIGRFFSSLPYELTGAQQRTVKEVLGDLCRSVPMRRLVQGDVGSGKTVIAAGAMLFAVKNSYQCVLMVPTEILASQHFDTLTKLYEGLDISVELLLGSTPAKNKKKIKEGLKNGSVDIVVGTNAVIQKDVEYCSLGLVITDEQHRFGVVQRAALAEKNAERQPHSLVMSATPIPRSLSLVLYGDMDISIIDELPAGRQKIETKAYSDEKREAVFAFLKKQIGAGSQAYIICPLVEENEELDRKSVEAYAELMQSYLPNVRAEFLHGRMKSADKDRAMKAFAAGEVSVLVSTTVVEVGVNVPNATVMLVENAECYGLSQLHQLRGRVGRGTKKSYCILMTGKGSEKSMERLSVMSQTNNGFEVANADLLQRGPGDFFGSRQSGELRFKHASMADMPLIEQTHKAIDEIEVGAGYTAEDLRMIYTAVDSFFDENGSKEIFN
ncbi:MAG: ATP-dependent DNA helicase RecG [Clostridia bacterium]|nr:ATP-dependent DNA helicase RecG [Clostridia bacterium]